MPADTLDELLEEMSVIHTIRKAVLPLQQQEDDPAELIVSYMWFGESVDSMTRLLAKYRPTVSEEEYAVAHTVFQLKSQSFGVNKGIPNNTELANALEWASSNPISENPCFGHPKSTKGLTKFIKNYYNRMVSKHKPA
jgi:hypothetical protein